MEDFIILNFINCIIFVIGLISWDNSYTKLKNKKEKPSIKKIVKEYFKTDLNLNIFGLIGLNIIKIIALIESIIILPFIFIPLMLFKLVFFKREN